MKTFEEAFGATLFIGGVKNLDARVDSLEKYKPLVEEASEHPLTLQLADVRAEEALHDDSSCCQYHVMLNLFLVGFVNGLVVGVEMEKNA